MVIEEIPGIKEFLSEDIIKILLSAYELPGIKPLKGWIIFTPGKYSSFLAFG